MTHRSSESGFVGASDRLGDLSADEGERLISLLTDDPRITRRSDLAWTIDGRDVDFDWLQSGGPSAAPEEMG